MLFGKTPVGAQCHWINVWSFSWLLQNFQAKICHDHFLDILFKSVFCNRDSPHWEGRKINRYLHPNNPHTHPHIHTQTHTHTHAHTHTTPKYFKPLTPILRRSRTGTVWFYTSTSNKRAARPKLYTMSLTRDLKRMYSRLNLVRISIKL